MTINEKYDKLIKPEIEALINEVESEILKNLKIKEYHKGWRVFFSPLIHKPKILFIGINPGAGQVGVVDLKYCDKEKLEYLQYWDDNLDKYVEAKYTLARETKEVFNLAGMLEILVNSAVKINFFFLSTAKERDIYQITTFLGRGKNQELLGDKLFVKSYEWTRKLIEIIEPEIVICEGKTAYTNVIDSFKEYGEGVNWENECAYTQFPKKNLTVIGYERTFSRIKNKLELVKLIKKFTNK